jgi:hypothetical protein
MLFPDDIMSVILSFLPTPYRKPPHLDAFNEIRAYRVLQELKSDPEYQEAIDTPDMYGCSSLYRFIMDDHTFRRRGCDLDGKWNPFMATYCSRAMSPCGIDLVDLGYGDAHNETRGSWSSRPNAQTAGLVHDFCHIQDHLRDVESLAWWFYY